MNALYQDNFAFALVVGFTCVAIFWLAGGVSATVILGQEFFWLGGLFGSVAASVLLWINSTRLILSYWQLEAELGMAIGAMVALAIAHILRLRKSYP